MSNGDNRYPQYPPPGQGAVHGVNAPHGYPAQPGGPPQQQPQGQPQRGEPSYPPQGPPPQPGGYPQDPPPQGQPGAQQPWNQGGTQVDPAMATAMADAVDQSKTGGVDADFVRPTKPRNVGETAETVLRVFPNWKGETAFWHMSWRHFVLVQLEDGNKRRQPRSCPAKNVPPGQPAGRCAICDRRERAIAAGDEKTAKALEARPRFYMNVIDANDQDAHWKVDPASGQNVPVAKVWDCTPGLFKKLTNIISSKGPIYDLQFGRFIKVFAARHGNEDRDIRYDCIDATDPCPVPPGFEATKLVELDQLDGIRTYEEMANDIAATYPDPQGMPVGGAQPPQQPAGAQPPYGPPAGYGAPQGQQQAPQNTQASHFPNQQQWQGQQPQQAAPPPQQWQQPQQPQPPQSYPPAQEVPAGAPGWAVVNGQWVQVPTGAPPQQQQQPQQPQQQQPQPQSQQPQPQPPQPPQPQGPPQGPGPGGDGDIPF